MSSTPVVVLDSTLTDIADAIRGKNGSSDTYKPSEMPAAITAIPSGGGGVGIPREVDANGAYGFPTQQFTFSLPSTAVDLTKNALYYAFNSCSSLASVDLSSLVAVSGNYALEYAFYHCTNLTSVNLSSLVEASGSGAISNAFDGCTSLASVNLSSLTTASGAYAFNNAFHGCNSLTSVNFSSLTTISGRNAFGSAFSSCGSLSSLSFPALTASGFGSNTDQFNNMLGGCSNVTVHFPAAIQSTIGSWASVTNGFRGTNTTVLFDL